MPSVMAFAGVWLACLFFLANARASGAEDLLFQARKLVRGADTNSWHTTHESLRWAPKATAAVVCDMWDKHWCAGATRRVQEMAPRMNQVLSELRRSGVLIIHCPSDTLKFYEGTPARELARTAPAAPTRGTRAWAPLDPTREQPLPIDDSDGGCDDLPACSPGTAWTRQIATLEIHDGDAVTDSAEALHLMRQRGITNVLIMGVHQNMCVLGRPFSIRQMVYEGQNVLLVRDLTDSMYNSRQPPFVDHLLGNDLVTWHIEKYWCGTITSDQVIGGSVFRFSEDKGPLRVSPGSPAASNRLLQN